MTNPGPWWTRAECRDDDRIDPALPGLGQRQREKIATFYCLGCPVKQQCAADALRHRDIGVIRAGVWIGASRITPSKVAHRRLERIATVSR